MGSLLSLSASSTVLDYAALCCVCASSSYMILDFMETDLHKYTATLHSYLLSPHRGCHHNSLTAASLFSAA